MTNTSATGGYLSPAASPKPAEDDDLDNILQAMVAGITGLDPALVRPRWQPEPGNLPPMDENWASVGVTHRTGDAFPVIQHDGSADGTDILVRHENLDLLCTFYGPDCQGAGAKLRDGLSIAQNREALSAAGLELIAVGDLTKAPELIKNRWLGRADLPVALRRAVTRVYPVLNLLSAGGDIVTDAIDHTFTIDP